MWFEKMCVLLGLSDLDVFASGKLGGMAFGDLLLMCSFLADVNSIDKVIYHIGTCIGSSDMYVSEQNFERDTAQELNRRKDPSLM